MSVNEVNEGISRLECNKACGLDGVSAEHLKHYSSRVTPLLAMCITGFMVHVFLPESMISVVLIRIIKDKKAKISSIDNYRPVAIASVVSMAYAKKKDGSLRICLDPKLLNQALKRPHHHIPTLEELNHKFTGARYFSKLDAKAGYWGVQLHNDSQLLTTFQFPYGRYAFKRLPFGLSAYQDIFQSRMDMILEQCDGAEGIADDVVVYGATEDEHDKNLHQLMNVAMRNGLVFNSSKCLIKERSVSFFGLIHGIDDIKPDPDRIRDIQDIPPPRDKKELQQLLGLMTFLSPFIRNLSEKASMLRDLLKEDGMFMWELHHQSCFDGLKHLVATRSCLQYFNVAKTPILQTDASLLGLGVALLQENESGVVQPVAYASKSLSGAEKRYACIERELLLARRGSIHTSTDANSQ